MRIFAWAETAHFNHRSNPAALRGRSRISRSDETERHSFYSQIPGVWKGLASRLERERKKTGLAWNLVWAEMRVPADPPALRRVWSFLHLSGAPLRRATRADGGRTELFVCLPYSPRRGRSPGQLHGTYFGRRYTKTVCAHAEKHDSRALPFAAQMFGIWLRQPRPIGAGAVSGTWRRGATPPRRGVQCRSGVSSRRDVIFEVPRWSDRSFSCGIPKDASD